MSINLFFGNRVNPSGFERIPIQSVNLGQKIEELKSIASQKINLPSELLGRTSNVIIFSLLLTRKIHIIFAIHNFQILYIVEMC